jgi:O-acetyl-ADP-ribose deacetylase (regulator of RNase III)
LFFNNDKLKVTNNHFSMDSMKKKTTFLQGWVTVGVGDITAQSVDVIVNAANSKLAGGGGVDGAIHKAGGPIILEECQKVLSMRYPEGLPTGESVATTAGNLHAKWVIHTVGPIFGRWAGHESELLRACYWNSLALARELGATCIAFPSISCGIYGFPRELAAEVVSQTLSSIQSSVPGIKEVRLIFFNDEDAFVFLDNEKFAK